MKRTIQQFIDDEYAEGSKPHPTTVVRRIQRGQLPVLDCRASSIDPVCPVVEIRDACGRVEIHGA